MLKRGVKKIITLTLVTMSVSVVNPIGANAAWKSNAIGWWYTEGSSYAKGWRDINGKSYYFYSNGYMAKCDKINGYFVNDKGEWSNSITQADALGYVQKQDSHYIGDLSDRYGSAI